MMDRVRSSRSTCRGVEVARDGVARRLQPMLNAGLDVHVRSLEPILILPCLSRLMAVETSKGKCFKKYINFKIRG